MACNPVLALDDGGIQEDPLWSPTPVSLSLKLPYEIRLPSLCIVVIMTLTVQG
jgi:hypothetical protein